MTRSQNSHAHFRIMATVMKFQNSLVATHLAMFAEMYDQKVREGSPAPKDGDEFKKLLETALFNASVEKPKKIISEDEKVAKAALKEEKAAAAAQKKLEKDAAKAEKAALKEQKAAAAAEAKAVKDAAKAEKAALKEQKAAAAAEAKAVKDAAKAAKAVQKEKLAKEIQIAKENRQREREEKKRVTDAEKLKKNKFRQAVKAIAKDEGITQKAAILKLQEGSYLDKYLSAL